MGIVLVLLTLGLAFANGANDVSKGIATLVGSGTTKYRAAVLWGTAWTVAGATSFFRGLNDTPKILALGVAATAGVGISGPTFYALVAAALLSCGPRSIFLC